MRWTAASKSFRSVAIHSATNLAALRNHYETGFVVNSVHTIVNKHSLFTVHTKPSILNTM